MYRRFPFRDKFALKRWLAELPNVIPEMDVTHLSHVGLHVYALFIDPQTLHSNVVLEKSYHRNHLVFFRNVPIPIATKLAQLIGLVDSSPVQ